MKSWWVLPALLLAGCPAVGASPVVSPAASNSPVTAVSTAPGASAAATVTATAAVVPSPVPSKITTDAAVTTRAGLGYTILTAAPAGAAVAKSGDTLSMDYTGWLVDGTVFDSSIPRHAPFGFKLGAGRVIQGWDLGCVGMGVGETRKLVIPPDLGYGAQSNGKIPANSTLIFEVKLLSLTPAPKLPETRSPRPQTDFFRLAGAVLRGPFGKILPVS